MYHVIFLDHQDIINVTEVLERGEFNPIEKYYNEDLFFSKLEFTEKEAVLNFLCKESCKIYDLPEDYYELVIQRELHGQTDFGNLAAIPHSIKAVSEESFVAVGILNKPIWWGHHHVQVIFLLSISKDGDEGIRQFYRMTTELIFDQDKMQQLIQNPSYKLLLELLQA